MNRGDRREAIFAGDVDRQRLLETLMQAENVWNRSFLGPETGQAATRVRPPWQPLNSLV
jgi:hypothetical protein